MVGADTQAVALLVNENVPAPLVQSLRSVGLDVEWVAQSMPAAADRVVLQHAARTGRWILTFAGTTASWCSRGLCRPLLPSCS